jgi:hypothetical protein
MRKIMCTTGKNCQPRRRRPTSFSCSNSLKADTDPRRDLATRANFQFSMTLNFNIFQCFSNIRNHLSNFSYLVCIPCKIFIRWRFYLFWKLKIRVALPNCVRSVWALIHKTNNRLKVQTIDILYTLDSASLLVKLKPRIFQRLPPFE